MQGAVVGRGRQRRVPASPPKGPRHLGKPSSEAGQAFVEAFKALHLEGAVADRGELPVEWGRVSKATEETLGFSLDVVHMNGAGPDHVHPTGEASFCVPLEGDPEFEGTRSGWHVLPPGSRHVPQVKGGRMLIVYLLPNGEMEFL